jgi:hypothetical protein
MSHDDESLERQSFECRVAEQHRVLDALFADVLEAVRARDPGARDAFAKLREGLEVHFGQEERLYYPAVRSLSPSRAESIAAIVRAHDAFRAQLEAVAASLAAARGDEAALRLAAFVDDFALHEAAEEGLLGSLDREIRAASGPTPPDAP